MADNRSPHRGKEWRDRITTGLLVKRLNDNALDKLDKEMTQGQIQSAKILLGKTIPDLKSIEHSTGNLDTYESLVERLSKTPDAS